MRKKLLTLLGIMLPLLANAYSFVSNGIYYQIKSSQDKTVYVTYKQRNSGYSDERYSFPSNSYIITAEWGDDDFRYDYILNDYTGAVTIPSSVTYGGSTYRVTGIDSYAFAASRVTSVNLPSTIKEIAYKAFINCSSITNWNIPSSVTKVGENAFSGCGGTLTVNSVQTLYYETEEWDDDDNKYYLRHFPFKSSRFSTIILNNITSLPDGYYDGGAFSYCSSLSKVILPSKLYSIGSKTFSYCNNLSTVEFPDESYTIGNEAFYGCSSLSSINLKSVSKIGDSAFGSCSNIASVSITYPIPNSISSYAFPKNTEIHVIEHLKPVYDATSGWNNYTIIDDIELPNNMMIYKMADGSKMSNPTTSKFRTTKGGNSTIVNYHNASTGIGVLKWDGDLTTIYDAFTSYNLEEVVLPNSVASIGNYAFQTCSNLKSINMPASLTTLGSYCFYNCRSLASDINIPDGVKSIPYMAFSACSSITNLSLPVGLTSINESAFDGCSSLSAISTQASRAKNLRKASSLVNLPSTLTSIGEKAFKDCTSLTSFVIPEGVEGIANGTFKGCSSLGYITIPSSVASIGNEAFSGCVGLNTITCNVTTPPSCGTNVFYNVTKPSVVLIVPEGSESLYANDSNWNEFKSPNETITLGASDYSTYCTNVNLDFSEVEGLKAYIASSFNPSTGSLTITRVTNVPAGEGILLKGTAGESYDVPVTSDASVVANLMKGNTTSITLDPTTGEYTNFVLSQNSEGVMGFYRFNNSITMPAHKAWLQIPTNTLGAGNPAHVKGFRFVEEGDEMTGIANIEADSAISDAIYDLQGRRLNSQPAHGLYIQNGKKIIK